MADISKELLLGGLLYFHDIREHYIRNVMSGPDKKPLLAEITTTPYATVENLIRIYIKADIDTNAVVIFRRLLEQYEKIPPAKTQYKSEFIALLNALDDRDRFTEQICMRSLQERIQVRVAQNLMAELKLSKTNTDLKETVSNALSALNQSESRPTGFVLYDPIADMEKLLVNTPRVPTGIRFLDELTGGGIVFGEHLGILGPSGGGKSTITNQLVCNLAIQGYKSLLIQFEQAIAGDITSRVYSYLSKRPIDTFYGKSIDQIPVDIINELKAMRTISNRVRMTSMCDVDTKSKGGSVQDIIDIIDQAVASGFKPDVVLVDWLGAAVMDFMRVSSTDKSYPLAAEELQDTLNKYGKANKITFIYLHQTSNAAQNQPPSYKPTKNDSYQYGAFANKLETCLQIGTSTTQKDDTRICWLVVGKARNAVPGKAQIIRLNGRMARMEMTEPGEFVIGVGGQFVSIADMVQTNEPKEMFVVSEADDFVGQFK